MALIPRRRSCVWRRFPELDLAIFAFLLNFPWEFLQAPLFAGMAQMPHWQAVKACTRATFGDVAIMLLAFWLVCAAFRNRHWILSPSPPQLALLVCIGVAITVVIERLALQGLWIDAWRYALEMPVVPGLHVGMAPVLQWIVLPPLVVWFVRRQSL